MLCPSCQAENDDSAAACFSCGAALTVVVVRGTLIAGRYEILSSLGKGGMGVVYKAHDRVLDETVALKLLRSDLGHQAEMSRRFRSEIKLARKVRHRNVCGIHEYGEAGPLRFIAMEFIEGTDLRQVLRARGSLPMAEAFDTAVQVAEGLQAVHEVGVVHRDLKTPNIMRDARGVVRLMDFGIAKEWAAEAAAGATATGLIVGTPEYMSPEQARGGRIDQRSDVYAMGIVVFELFTGDVPFRGETPIATILKHLQDPLPLEGPQAEALPAELLPVLRRALAKDPADRYDSARDMADALRAAWAASVPAPPTAESAAVTAPAARPVARATPHPTPLPTPVPTSVPTAVSTQSAMPLSGARGLTPMPVAAASSGPMEGPQAAPASWELELGPTVAVATPTPQPAAAVASAAAPVHSTSPATPLGPTRPPAPTAPPERHARRVPRPAVTPAPRTEGAPPAVRVGLALLAVALVLGGWLWMRSSPETPAGLEPPGGPAGSVRAGAGTNPGAGEPSGALPATVGAGASGAPTASPSGPGAASGLSPRPAPPSTQHPRPERAEPARAAETGRPLSAPTSTQPRLELRPAPGPAPATPLPMIVVQTPAPSPVVAISGEAQPTPAGAAAAPAAPGLLQVAVRPWAEVSVDGASMGLTPLNRITLSAGSHKVRLTHPAFEPLERTVVVRTGETFKLVVDLTTEGVRKK